MSKEEFMKELDYLLSVIPDEDKKDALDYYRDYLDEAGDMADKAIEEFGSPERIAAIVRSDIRGDLGDGGAFTERGYEDERFRDPNYQVVKRHDLPEAREEADSEATEAIYEKDGTWNASEDWRRGNTKSRDGFGSTGSNGDQGWKHAGSGLGKTESQDSFGRGSTGNQKEPGSTPGSGERGSQSRPLGSGDQGRIVKIILFAILVMIALPVLVGIGGGIFGVIVGVLSVFFAMLVVQAVLTFAFLLAGIALCVAGVIAMFTNLLDGLFCFGVGLIVLALGMVSLVISVWFYGKLVPWLIRGCVKGCGHLFHRKERRV